MGNSYKAFIGTGIFLFVLYKIGPDKPLLILVVSIALCIFGIWLRYRKKK